MEIFLDTAKVEQIKQWLGYGVLDGVTTNPSILFKDGGYDIQERTREIAELIYPRPLSVEVSTNEPKEMLEQGRAFAKWGDNIVVKIPVINEDGVPCLDAVNTLTNENIKVNMTAVMSLGQFILGAKAGATYGSIFAGRVADEGNDASELIERSARWLKTWGYETKIIVGSIRTTKNIQDAAVAGAHVLTIPPDLLGKWVDHQYSRSTVKQFNIDAKKAFEQLRESQGVTASP